MPRGRGCASAKPISPAAAAGTEQVAFESTDGQILEAVSSASCIGSQPRMPSEGSSL